MYERVCHIIHKMEAEIYDTSCGPEKTTPKSNLELCNIVFVKRENIGYPEIKSKGPYLFLCCSNEERTFTTLYNLINSKTINVNITKVSSLKIC